MLIVRLKGGLGNQMFQYAFGRKISLMKNIQVKFDISFFKNDVVYNHHYELNHFNIIENIASSKEVNQFIFGKFKRGLSGLALKFIDKALPNYKRRVVKEQKIGFDFSIFKASDNTYFDGYWGKYAYFADIRDVLLKDFEIKPEFENSTYKNLKNKILQTKQSISVHIRRGYEKQKTDLEFFGVLSLEYYEKAIKFISEKIEKPKFYVFSDDIGWAKNNLQLSDKHEFINLGAEGGYLELNLMSCCKHNIIANSTFSWWGAWLNENVNKIVIAPKRWYNKESYQKHYEKGYLVPKEWIKL